MAKTNGKVHNINLINLDYVKSEMLNTNLYNKEEINNQKCIEYIMSNSKDYEEQKLETNVIDGVELHFYYYGYNIKTALNKFSADFVKQDQEIFKKEGLVQNSVLFLIVKSRIYAVPTGQGFRAISKFIIDNFGLVALKSMDASFKVTALNSNNMSGKTHSENRVFRQELDFFDIQDVDSIIKGLKGKINSKETICKLLNIPQDSKKNKLTFMAKDSLQLSSSMKLEELVKSLKAINELIPDKIENDFIDIKLLDKNKDSKDIARNQDVVYLNIAKNIENQSETYLGYDFFNKDVESFLDYNKYILKYNETEKEFDDSYEVFATLRSMYTDLKINEKSEDEKISFVKNIYVLGVNDDEYKCPFGNLIENLSGEVVCEDKHYFMWYGIFYYVENNYFNRLNGLLQKKLSLYKNDNFLPKWQVNDEDAYNSKLADTINGLLIHKCIPDNIEFADVLKFDETKCYIYHVKDNFNCSMRELDRQVELSMKKLSELSRFSEYFVDLYNRSKNQAKRNDKNELYKYFSSAEEFVDKIKKVTQFIYKIVINVADKNDILNSESNIAKYCFKHILSLSTEYNYEIELCFVK